MKRLFLCFLLTLIGAVISPPPSIASETSSREFTTGRDWAERMSPREKFMALIPPSILFSEYEVHTKLSLPQYILLIDKLMDRNPRLQNEEVSSIFASTVYFFEPENRPALQAMELEFLRPRLTIQDVIPETAGAEN